MAVHLGTSGGSYARWENVLHLPGLQGWDRCDAYLNNDGAGNAERNADGLRALLESP